MDKLNPELEAMKMLMANVAQFQAALRSFLPKCPDTDRAQLKLQECCFWARHALEKAEMNRRALEQEASRIVKS